MLIFSKKAIEIPTAKKLLVLRINSGDVSPYIKNRDKDFVWDYNAKSVADDSQEGIFGIRVDYLSVGFDFHVRVIFASIPMNVHPKILLLEINRDDIIDNSKITEISFRRANIIKVFSLSDFQLFSMFVPQLSYIPHLFDECMPLRLMYQKKDYMNWVEAMKENFNEMFERLSKVFPQTYIENVKKRYAINTKDAGIQMKVENLLREIIHYHNKRAHEVQ